MVKSLRDRRCLASLIGSIGRMIEKREKRPPRALSAQAMKVKRVGIVIRNLGVSLKKGDLLRVSGRAASSSERAVRAVLRSMGYRTGRR